MKTVISILLVASCLSSIYSTAAAEVSGNVALQSDYVWRGVSQNSEDPAIQGGFDYAHESGIYLGLWGSGVNFNGAESTEIDLYTGWRSELKSGFGIDIGIMEYTYHGQNGASDSDFTEYYGGVTYKGFGVKYSIGDEFDDLFEISYHHDFDAGIRVSANYADYHTYQYYTFGISKEFQGVGFDLSYWDTDINNDKLADAKLVLTISKEF